MKALMDPSYTALSQTELFQLAIDASRRKEFDIAIAYLKEAVTRADASPEAYFLLGAEYAQIGMTGQARYAMEAAVALAPGLGMARFHLGLLLLSGGGTGQAVNVLAPLRELGSMHMLTHFSGGLVHLSRNEFTEAVECLRAGIRLNTQNAALNADMQRLIAEIEKLPAKEANERMEEGSTCHLLIAAYTGNGTTGIF